MSSGPKLDLRSIRGSVEKKLGPVKKEPRHGLSILKNSTLIFSCLPIYIIVSLFRVSLLWGERLFTEGLSPICWDNKSSSKLRDVALYMCGHMIKPHCLLSSKMKVASLLFSNTNIDFQRISLHRLPVAKSSLSKPGKCILFSYSLHSAVKKKKKTSLNSPGCLILHLGLTSGGRILLFTLPYFFSRFLSKPCSWGARWS